MKTKKKLSLAVGALTALLLSLGSGGTAQAAESGDRQAKPGAEGGSGVIVFAAQRFWATTWDIPMMDAELVLPDLVSPPVLKTNLRIRRSDTTTIPITTVGALFGGLSLSSSYFSSADFQTNDTPSSTVSRREWDVAVGYAVLPNLSLSVAYRKARISEGTTPGTQALTGFRGGYDMKGWLAGLSASAPLAGRLSLYGNIAVGTVTEIIDNPVIPGNTDYKGSYRIGELGLSYRLMGAQDGSSFFKSLSAQIGYRAQIVTVRDFDFPVFAVSGTMVANQKTDVRSTADGMVLGIVAAF